MRHVCYGAQGPVWLVQNSAGYGKAARAPKPKGRSHKGGESASTCRQVAVDDLVLFKCDQPHHDLVEDAQGVGELQVDPANTNNGAPASQ